MSADYAATTFQIHRGINLVTTIDGQHLTVLTVIDFNHGATPCAQTVRYQARGQVKL